MPNLDETCVPVFQTGRKPTCTRLFEHLLVHRSVVKQRETKDRRTWENLLYSEALVHVLVKDALRSAILVPHNLTKLIACHPRRPGRGSYKDRQALHRPAVLGKHCAPRGSFSGERTQPIGVGYPRCFMGTILVPTLAVTRSSNFTYQGDNLQKVIPVITEILSEHPAAVP